MTIVTPGIPKSASLLGHELPVVAARVQRKPQHSVGGVIGSLAVGDPIAREMIVTITSCTHHELPDAMLRVRDAGRPLAGETLVIVGVAINNHIGAPFV